jgi:hypothetical protein
MPPQPQHAVTFQGWTNIAGKTYAIVLFPTVTERRKEVWAKLCKSNYQLRIEYELMNQDGSINLGFFEESGGNSPRNDTSIRFPVDEKTSMIRLLRAESQMFRYWDNLELPFPPPRPRWKFSVPRDGSSEWIKRSD